MHPAVGSILISWCYSLRSRACCFTAAALSDLTWQKEGREKGRSDLHHGASASTGAQKQYKKETSAARCHGGTVEDLTGCLPVYQQIVPHFFFLTRMCLSFIALIADNRHTTRDNTLQSISQPAALCGGSRSVERESGQINTRELSCSLT